MRYLPLSVLFSLITFAVYPQAPQPVIVVPIQNPSFQEGQFGWSFAGSSGVMQWNGISVAYAGYDGSLSQVLTMTPAMLQEQGLGRPGNPADSIYTLKVSVANYYGPYPGYVTAKISFGTQELCEASNWGTRNWNQLTFTCLGPGYLINGNSLPGGGMAQGDENLKITFTVNDESANGGWPLLFKDVSLAFTEQSNE